MIATTALAGFDVAFEGDTVTACSDELKLGASAVLFVVGWPEEDWVARKIARAVEVVDDDFDRCISYQLEEPIPQRSIWAFMPFNGNSVTFVAPPGYQLVEETFDPEGLVVDEEVGRITSIVVEGKTLDFFLLRPGVGGWRLTAADGRSQDDDGQMNSRIQISVSDLLAQVRSRPAPASLQLGDVLIVVDPLTMSYMTTVIQ
jgi:hypothetical protein